MSPKTIHYFTDKELSNDDRKSLLYESLSNEKLKKEMMDYQNLNSLMNLHSDRKDEQAGRISLNRFMKARQKEKVKRLFFKSFFKVAAFLVCILSTWWITQATVSMGVPSPVAQKLTVPAGQRAHILLPDGTSAWVNAGSTLSYPSMFGEERRVEITGEAFFQVAKGETPFIVSGGKTDIRALGTQFNVFNYPSEDLTVSLLEGSVNIYRPGSAQKGVTLSPNQQLTETDGRFVVTTITHNPIDWKEGIYAFEHQPMEDILKKLELYYDVKFTVKHTPILNYRYTGKFRQRDGVMEVLRIIRKIHPFQVKQIENTNEIILYR